MTPTPSPWWLSQRPREHRTAGETAHPAPASRSGIHGHRDAGSSSGTWDFLPPAGEAHGNRATPEVAEAPAGPADPLTSPNSGSACDPEPPDAVGVSPVATPVVPAALTVPRHQCSRGTSCDGEGARHYLWQRPARGAGTDSCL